MCCVSIGCVGDPGRLNIESWSTKILTLEHFILSLMSANEVKNKRVYSCNDIDRYL
jgi:hypothetical protein